MHTRAILLILGWTIGVHGASLIPRIVGGHDAQQGMYPYQAIIKVEKNFMCGGSIISEHLILTAAHCIYRQDVTKYEVIVGTYYLSSSTNPGVSYSAKQLIWHSGYDSQLLRNDIGLIRLNDRISFNTSRIEPIPLASVDYVAPNTNAVVTGWGKLSAGGQVSPFLQEITLKILSQDVCKTIWQGNVKESQICTFTKQYEGVCNGDSGGPLVVDGKQVGIVSFGIPCGRGAPDVYTRVYSYKSWIISNAESIGDHIHGSANIVSKTWIPILLATAMYLHFFA
ncbi:chymotrypsin-2-like [Halictus rubicundus]|uniref:chymotrypsin-2-like n=1 Tax=Halictus rubicundus TaxID=77578 RepID=UPI004034FD00